MKKAYCIVLAVLMAVMPVYAASYTKTIQTELLAITNIAAGSATVAGQAISTVLSCTTCLAATVLVDISPEATNVPGTEIRVDVSQKASGNDTWVTLTSVVSTTATVNSNAVDGTEAAGQTTIEETTTTGLAQNQTIFFKNGTLGNSEWQRLISVNGTTDFRLLEGLTNAQTSSTWYNRGERFVFQVDMTAVTRLRVIINNNYGASAVAVNARVAAITADSIQ